MPPGDVCLLLRHAPQARKIIHIKKKKKQKQQKKPPQNNQKEEEKKNPTNLTLLIWRAEWLQRWLVGSNLANRNDLALPVSSSSDAHNPAYLPSNFKLQTTQTSRTVIAN